jgi:hypothetical protein
MALTIHELAKLQADYPDYRMELIDGEVMVMSPSQSSGRHPWRGRSKSCRPRHA